MDADGVLLYVSPSIKTVLGYEPEAIAGRSAFDLIHPDDVERTKDRFQRGASRLTLGRMEFRCRHANGHYIWLESVGNFVTGRVVVSSRDISNRKEMEEQLRFLSLFDSLTGLYNRNYFEQEMERLDSGRSNPVGVIVCDVDGLKLYNDTLGHVAGDQLLREIAGIIRDCFRSSDVVARIGGDEFAVLLPNTSLCYVDEVSRRVRDAVAEYNKNHQLLPLSISLGYSVRETMAETMASVLRQADDDMYREKLHRSQSVRSAVSQILRKALETKDFMADGHGRRLETYAVALARRMGLAEHRISELRLLAQYHDIGKVGIRDQILFKPGPLTEAEKKEIQRHCETGHRIARSAPDLAPIADWILKHHEWWNGQGYPFGIKEEAIPMECRILAIADAYDAMVTDRPWRSALSQEAAFAELQAFRGVQFDPQLVDVFLELLQTGEFAGDRTIAG
jgi:diguanylate cyclase (GGDEF)-like protein/PAS domain S-box-containing protein